jgi:hypothetical protein
LWPGPAIEEATVRYLIGLTLIGFGVFTLTAGAFLRFYVAPGLIAAPTDIYQVTRLRADNATYFDGAAVKTRTGVTLTATNTVRGDVSSSHGDTAVWDSTTVIQDLSNSSLVDVRQQRAVFDRRTGQLANCCGASVQGNTSVRQSGIGLFWPVNVERKNYQLFDIQTKRSWPIEYEGQETVHGVRTYRFVQTIPATKVTDPVPDVPGNLLGLSGKAANKAIPVDRYYESRATYWIDPRTGAPLDQQQQVLSTLRAKSGPGQLVVANMNLRLTAESQKVLLDKVQNGAGAIRTLKVIIPLAGVLAGLVITLIGAVLSRRNDEARHRRPAEETVTVSG